MDPAVQWALGVLVIILVPAVGGLVRTVIKNGKDIAGLQKYHNDDDAGLKLWCTERFVGREDYVPQIALMGNKIDSMARGFERLDERFVNLIDRLGERTSAPSGGGNRL